MIRLTCRRCKGTGTIPNVAYEVCRTMQSHDAKRYFYINQEHSPGEENEKGDGCAVHEKTVPCPQCDGEGSLEFDEDEWELTVVPEEDEEG
jgi:RecJ-like exonuclease